MRVCLFAVAEIPRYDQPPVYSSGFRSRKAALPALPLMAARRSPAREALIPASTASPDAPLVAHRAADGRRRVVPRRFDALDETSNPRDAARSGAPSLTVIACAEGQTRYHRRQLANNAGQATETRAAC